MSARGARLVEGAVVCALYGVLAFVLLWPLFADPARATLDPDRAWLAGWFDPAAAGRGQAQAMLRDMRLLQWIYAWNWHALTTAPLAWFDANMFHPTPHALAYSEHALGKLPTTAPVFAFGGNPVLAFQVDLWLCFVLSGGALYALLRHAGAVPAAAFVGGFAYAFAPARLDMLFHPHLLAGQYLPLALLYLDRTLCAARLRAALAFAALLLLHLLCSYYLAYMALLGVPAYALGLVVAGRREVSRHGLLLALGAFALALAAFAVPSWFYLQVRARGAVWDYRDVAQALYPMSNHPWLAYLWPPALAGSAGSRLPRGCYAYLGVVAVALAALAVASLRGLRASARRALAGGLCLTVVAWLLALGPLVRVAGREVALPYAWLMHLVPGFASMRVPGRFALLLMIGFAVLVGLGCDRLLRAIADARPRHARALGALVAALLVAAIAWDDGLARLPIALRRDTPSAERIAVYDRLATLPRAPLLEIPALDVQGLLAVDAQVNSARHWQPLLTGSSGYSPPTYRFVEALVRRLPDPAALALLVRMTGLRYVLVHEAALPRAEQRRWASAPGLEPIGPPGSERLYQVVAPPEPDLLPAMLACTRASDACGALEELVTPRAPGSQPPA